MPSQASPVQASLQAAIQGWIVGSVGQGQDVAEPDLVHGLHGREQHDPKRQQEEQGGRQKEGVDADPAPGQMARATAGRPGCGHVALRLERDPYWE